MIHMAEHGANIFAPSLQPTEMVRAGVVKQPRIVQNGLKQFKAWHSGAQTLKKCFYCGVPRPASPSPPLAACVPNWISNPLILNSLAQRIRSQPSHTARLGMEAPHLVRQLTMAKRGCSVAWLSIADGFAIA